MWDLPGTYVDLLFPRSGNDDEDDIGSSSQQRRTLLNGKYCVLVRVAV